MNPEKIEPASPMVAMMKEKSNKPSVITIPSPAYRLQFSINHIGKCVSSSKRRISWKFGFTNLSSFREGKENRDCRGEEHEVELVWSVHSGKKKVLWNGVNISHFFREKQLFEQVHFSWETRSGETFKIIAFEKPRAHGPQYDLLIDGKSFLALPRLTHLRAVDTDDVTSDISESSSVSGEVINSDAITYPLDDEATDILEIYEGTLFKSSMSPASQGPLVVEDDLTSELFSNNLESLRSRGSILIPGIEDILSRALVHAFSEDPSSCCSFSSASFENSTRQPLHIESNAIWDTLSWIRLNVDYAPRPDVEEQTRLFLQKQVDSIFAHVRHDNLGEEDAIRVLCSVTELLGLEIKAPLRKDTVLIHDLNALAEEEDMITSLKVFGDVIDVHISKVRNFGMCRFRDVDSATTLVSACAMGTFKVHGETPVASLVGPQVTSHLSSSSGKALNFDTNATMSQPSLLRRKSHQRNAIILDTSSAVAPFLTNGGSSPSLASLQKYSNILQPHGFVNIPARPTSPIMLDCPEDAIR